MLGTIVQNVQNFLGKRSQRKNPVILPKKEHNINLRNVSNYAIQVCRELKDAGYSAFIVGGAVRDLLIGHRPKDFDVATDATPEEVKKIIKRSVIIGKRFRLVHAIKGSETIEISTFRGNDGAGVQKDAAGRVVADNVYGEQHEDASRRDFTINAMYYDPTTEEVYDYHNGLKDIRNKVVRMIGNPATRFREDPVRILRAIRIGAKLGFKVDPSMVKEMPKMQHLLQNVPESRLVDEILKMMMSGAAIECIKDLNEYGITEDLPLMEPIRNPESWPMIKAGLEKTDSRILSYKPVSSSFVFAFLLWRLYKDAEKRISEENPDFTPAKIMSEAVKAVFASGAARGLQHRRLSDMVEIWRMQPRFHSRNMTSILKLVNHPRFRAAYDFLLLRASQGEVDSSVAEWWTAFYDADKKTRVEMARTRAKELAAIYREQRAANSNAARNSDGGTESRLKSRARKRRRPRRPESSSKETNATGMQDPTSKSSGNPNSAERGSLEAGKLDPSAPKGNDDPPRLPDPPANVPSGSLADTGEMESSQSSDKKPTPKKGSSRPKKPIANRKPATEGSAKEVGQTEKVPVAPKRQRKAIASKPAEKASPKVAEQMRSTARRPARKTSALLSASGVKSK